MGQIIGGYFDFSASKVGCKFEQFVWVDPAGLIPGFVYNLGLNGRNDVMVLATQKLKEI